jgi:hypothetical protein
MITCTHCGSRTAMGAHVVCADVPAMVLRCPRCMQVVLRCASDDGGRRLEMAGAQLPSAPPAG